MARSSRPIKNNLWIARKRAGYPQKVVAALLGKRCASVVSDYETGRKLPSFPTALQLELLYGAPLIQLYPDLYGALREELASRRKGKHPAAHRAIQTNICNPHVPDGSSPSPPAANTSDTPSSTEKS